MREMMSPPPKLLVSEWADAHRRLSSESSAEPGQWRTARNEPMRDVMDAACDPLCHTVVVMSSAQVGKTEALNNIVGYYADQDPAPMLFIQPTLQIGEAWSKDRLAPMIRDTPRLAGKFGDSKSKDSGNTLLHKTFPGGHITIAGANSPASLASRPVRIVLFDEVGRYPTSAGTEGDPIALALKRSTTFWNRKSFLTSTPGIKGVCRIESAFLEGDQRYFHVTCEDCEHEQRLHWHQVHWDEGDPRTAHYVCEKCGSCWDDAQRWRAVSRGRWIATQEFRGIASFQISELYSGWVRLQETVSNFLRDKKSPETLKTWVNTALGETWEQEAEKVDPHALEERCEEFGPEAPDKVLLVTCGVDVQGDRLEVERVGWGVDDESWSLEYTILRGDPASPELWRRLEAYIAQPTIREDGVKLQVRSTCIDSGGHYTQQVYKFARRLKSRRVFAIKGREEGTVWPTAIASRKMKASQTNVTIVGTTAAKDMIYSSLRMDTPGPSYCHFPKGRPLGYFEQLTSERVITKIVRGFKKRVYELPDGLRNEALDCRVYAYAALQSEAIQWGTEMSASALAAAEAEKERRAAARIAPEIADRSMNPRQGQANAPGPVASPQAAPVRRSSGFLGPRGSFWKR
jgi:phage terminase large subunit GpA-like protein